MKTYTMNNGLTIPALGFGTYLSKDGDEVYNAVRKALEAGYRHIDTAAFYGNEESIGCAIKDSGIAREELYITTKLWNDAHGYEEAKVAFASSMEKLQLDYLDLYLIHWPNPAGIRDRWQAANADAWRAMEELVAEGKVRSIGVSNFMVHHMDELLKTATIVPAVNQIRLAPGVYQEEIVAYCREKDIVIEAWSPLGRGELFTHPTMLALAGKYGKTVAQVALAWSWAQGFLPLPKSVTDSRIVENLDFEDIALSEEDITAITAITGVTGAYNPDEVNF
ncbi:aldo/keto reductase [Streptococcus cuniculi]|uniref:Aldo/keto reductase n=1 Tax=Streptococcus cuniculi TaxID=1432788 RepID=A0A4Y9J9A0_9STRE|nr:aldo/keto reductase [Streptococcus cuniculi]MBF0779253.1 aldo/keto reductase [Streptococcus cuniculi]TFU96758.1 aldo/keto reductase [Streptococcus cuniculi]